MKVRILALCIVMMMSFSGCNMKLGDNIGSTQPVNTSPTMDGISTTSPSGSTGPTVTPSGPSNPGSPETPEYYDTYHSGKPYTPWGIPCSFTLTSDSGNTISLAGNFPEESLGVLKRKYFWQGNTTDLNTAYMIGYFDKSQYAIQQPKTFFSDVSEVFVEQYYRIFQAGAGNATIDIRDAVAVAKHGIRMYRFVGVAQWTVNETQKENTFVAYVFQEPSGGYLCCLFQCKKKNWAFTQEIAENFVNTLTWEVSNAG